MNVLSLFDGMSCGQIALNRAGIKYDNYFACEIDKHAIKVTQHNYPNTIQLGDVTKVSAKDLPKIDLLIGGSPCQGFSLAGKMLNFEDERSKLFFEYLRLLKEIRETNPNVKFLLENVKMKQEWIETINELLGVKGVFINSKLVSAQNRPRWYWTNICNIEQPEDKCLYLKDIIEETVDKKYFIKGGRLQWLSKFGELKEKQGYVAFNPDKAKCLTVRPEPSWNCTYIINRPHGFNEGSITDGKVRCLTTTTSTDSFVLQLPSILQWPRGYNNGGIKAQDGKVPSLTTSSWPSNNLLLNEGLVRKLTPVECERLQTVPDGYTSCASDSQRYKMLGNGWTVDVIAHIFKGLKTEEENTLTNN